MHIEIKRACLIGGKHHAIGDHAEVNDRDGNYLIGTGSAVEATAKKPTRKRKVRTA